MSRVRVYIACSLDGFIAGPEGDLSWLPGANGTHFETAPGVVTYDAFIADVGALLMGRRTFDVVTGMGNWFYGDLAVLVATNRALPGDARATVRAVTGDIGTIIDVAQRVAGGKDVYLDGGNLIRQGLDAGLVDELIVTVAPVILGTGVPLFAGCAKRHRLDLVDARPFGAGMAQLRYRPLEHRGE